MTRAAEHAVALAEWTVQHGRFLREPIHGAFGRFSIVGLDPFLDPAQFWWTSLLEEHYPAIRTEAERVLRVRAALPNFQDVAPDWIRLTDDDQWKLFWFVGYGVWDNPNCLRCPTTAAVLPPVIGAVATSPFAKAARAQHVAREEQFTATWNTVLGHRPRVG